MNVIFILMFNISNASSVAGSGKGLKLVQPVIYHLDFSWSLVRTHASPMTLQHFALVHLVQFNNSEIWQADILSPPRNWSLCYIEILKPDWLKALHMEWVMFEGLANLKFKLPHLALKVTLL